MFNPLSVIPTFIMGVATGSLITWIRQRHLLAECQTLLKQVSDGCERPAESQPRFGMKALVVSPDVNVVRLFSNLLGERRIETLDCSLASSAASKLSSEKFEVIVLDCDQVEGSENVLKKLPGPHKQVVVIAIATEGAQSKRAAVQGATFIVARPIDSTEIRHLLRAAYGRMLRDLQSYFRLAVELPVTIGTATGALVQCRTLNLSQNGMAVTTRTVFNVGERINVTFAIPNTPTFVNGDGEVIWDDKHGKTGIRFQCTNPSEQAKFFEWLHDHLVMALDSENNVLPMETRPLDNPMGNWN